MECAIDGCGRPERKAGLCWGHHKLKSRNKDITVELKMQHVSRGKRKPSKLELLQLAATAYRDADPADVVAKARAKRNLANAARRYEKAAKLDGQPPALDLLCLVADAYNDADVTDDQAFNRHRRTLASTATWYARSSAPPR